MADDDDDLHPEFSAAFERVLFETCNCPESPGLTFRYCPRCGKENISFSEKALIESTGLPTLMAAEMHRCVQCHEQDNLEEFPYCPMCGMDLKANKSNGH